MPTLITPELIRLPARQADSMKGQNGRVLIVGGSEEYAGAPALSGIASLRCGADSTVIAAPNKVAWAINTLSPDLVTIKLIGNRLSMENFTEIVNYFPTTDVLLIGNGVSDHSDSRELLKKLIMKFEGWKILDGLALLSFNPRALSNAILLPNPREFLKVKTNTDIEELVARGNIVVQKSARTLVHSKQGDYENLTGNPGLTKAGTGDVLAGLAAGFLAQTKNPLQASINAVYYLGLLGDILFKDKQGYFFLASDLANEVKRIYKLSTG